MLYTTQLLKIEEHISLGSFDAENTDTGTLLPGAWWQGTQGQGLTLLSKQGSNRTANRAKEMQACFCKYFNTSGAVQWQDKMISQ